MSYNQDTALRLRAAIGGLPGLDEKKMFGGVCYLLHGNMTCGVVNDQLIVRCGPEAYPAALAKPHARVFDYAGRPMKGWIFVDPSGYTAEEDLRAWVDLAVRFVSTLAPK